MTPTTIDLVRAGGSRVETLDALADQARRAQHDGDWVAAERAYTQAIEKAQAEQPERAPTLMRLLGRVFTERGDYNQANNLYEASLVAAQKLGLKHDAASALNSMAIAAQFRGQLDVAETLYKRSAQMAAEVEDPRLCALVDMNLGIIASIRGDLSTALMRYQGSLERFRQLGDDQSCGRVLNNLGIIHVDVGEWASAELCFNSAFHFAERIRDLSTQGRIENNRAEMYLRRQQYEDARAACERSFRLFTRVESDSGLGTVHKFYGILYRETGKSQMAHMHFALSLKLARTCENPLLEAEVESERARLFVSDRNSQQALRCLNHAHRIFTELDARREILDLQRRIDRMQDTYMQALEMWSEQEEPSRYEGSTRRGSRVSEYAVRLGRAVGMEDAHWLRIGAYLHDIGNKGVPTDVLAKPGPLTQEEWEAVREHPGLGAQIIEALEFPLELRPMIRNHHEHWDGTGYPDRLSETQIPVSARIMCIADIFDALTTERSYRVAYTVAEALEIMQGEAGRIIDPGMFAIFRSMIENGDAVASPVNGGFGESVAY
ncbi:MAG TPA: HD domain-containing phosphohydrolase [Longimicrobiales bacterium]|nr:HD domain-containing phosphohydrolase [Longimicrobiales bacterium]